MDQQIRRAAPYPLAIALSAVLAMLGLSACGGSSGSSTASTAHTSTAASLAAAHSGTTGGGKQQAGHVAGTKARFTAVRECLQRNGVKLPQRGAGRGLFPGGGSLPPGTTRSQLQAAMSKCLGGKGHFFPGPNAGAARRFSSPTFRKALSSFASCLHQNGVDIPAPNTSGRGPVFSTKGIDTTSPKFREATKKCRGLLTAALGRP